LAGGGAAAWLLHFGLPVVETGKASIEAAEDRPGVVLAATGYVVARKTSNVGSRVAGRIAELLFEEGTAVSKGQVLARLESREAEARVAEARAELADAERETRRQEGLVRGGAAGEQALDAARTRLDLAKARLEVVEALLADLTIHAPFGGVVIQKPMEVGETVSFGVVQGQVSSGVLAVLADLTDLEVDTDVGEANIGRVVEGQPAEIVLDAYPDARFPAVVRKVMPRAVRRTLTVPVRVRFLEPDARVRPDLSAKVFFGAERSPAGAASRPGPRVFVPPAALLEREGNAFVRLLRDQRSFLRSVRVGAREEGRVEILEGLAGGETLITAGAADLKDGARVRTKSRP
ncbi:MAG TPA: efflux RND transporter periplasmic adaptor subunit, partial [Planctomycetota bacterium]|nr:efflux RND transporter periplasmic adaptor subunit [Planctomycetota bacterium]